jgi:E3 ubiquitin-protein ligase RNF14
MTESEDHLSSRKEEILALTSIYDELILNPDQLSGSIVIPVEPDTLVTLVSPTRQENVRFLPGIQFTLFTRDKYPESEPPEISIKCSWVSQEKLIEVEESLRGIWEGMKDLCLFTMIDELFELAKTLFGLEMLQVSEAVLEHVSEFAEKEETKRFEEGTHFCGVCLEHKKGKECFKLSRCGHVFCKVSPSKLPTHTNGRNV